MKSTEETLTWCDPCPHNPSESLLERGFDHPEDQGDEDTRVARDLKTGRF